MSQQGILEREDQLAEASKLIDSVSGGDGRLLAAEGFSNPEIAQTLFVTRKTVEKHVSEVLRKLEVSSRHEIGAAIEPQAIRDDAERELGASVRDSIA